MASTNCSRCGESFHLRISSEENLQKLKLKEKKNEVLCLGCFKTLKLYNTVKVIGENSSVPKAKPGDEGAIVLVHENMNEFEVESVKTTGETKWLGTFSREQLKWLKE